MVANPGALYGRPWSEREYVLVLDAYLSSRGQPRHENSQFVQELAVLLGRTPASIYMRMENFASMDPSQSERRRGLAKIGPVGQDVFGHWIIRPDALESSAALFRREIEGDQGQMDLFRSARVPMPRAFGKYELLDPLGQGGFGSVYSCVHEETREFAAIKIIRVEQVQNPDLLHRFIREIRALKTVDSPFVVKLKEENLQQEKRFPAYVMELAECSLTEHIQRCSNDSQTLPILPFAEGLKILSAMATALEALHLGSPRIIHRDLNPNNILLLSDGRWVLADFGLAKFLDHVPVTTSFQTNTKQAGCGSAFYAAPEQYRDFKKTDLRTDVYALGVLLWELFSNIGPPIDRQDTGLPPAMNEVFLRATERDPDRRYASVREFMKAFALSVRTIHPSS